MKHTLLALPIAAALLLGAPVLAAPSLVITSPHDRAVVHNPVMVRWDLKGGHKGDHFHLYLDGELLTTQYTRERQIKHLSPGAHTFKVIAATASHQEEHGASASISFTVK